MLHCVRFVGVHPISKSLVLLLLTCLPGGWVRAEPVVTLTSGWSTVSYRENVDLVAVDSEWTANAWTVGGELRWHGWGQDWFGTLDYLDSGDARETWKNPSGLTVQSNALNVERFRVTLGWVSPAFVLGNGDGNARVYGFGGQQRFERSRFRTHASRGLLPFEGELSEIVDLAGVGVDVACDWPLAGPWRVALGLQGERIFWDEAVNTGFDARVSGQGGWEAGARMGLVRRRPSPGSRLGLWLGASVRTMEGGQMEAGDRVVEWPENEWTELYAELQWSLSW